MFIIENKKITNAKSLSIGKAQQFDIQLKFVDTTFSDDDVFELTIDSKKSSLYGFVESGCLRFTRVDFSWIKSKNTTASISVKCNGTEILSDSIDITAEVQGGSEVQGIVFDNSPYKATSVEIIPENLTADWTNFSSMFLDFKGLTTISQLDTSNGTNFNNMFHNCLALTSMPALDTSKGTNFSSMFYLCQALTSVPALDTSKGTNFSSMFSNCRALTSMPALDTSKGTNFSSMFAYCLALTTIEGIDFSGATSAIPSTIFYNCSALISIKINGTIAKNIDFSQAPNLDAASCISIAQALVENTGALTITFHSTTYNNVLLQVTMPGTTTNIKDYIVDKKGWGIKTV